MAFTPHTPQDIQTMLETIGVDSVEALFDEIPKTLLAPELTELPPALSEMETLNLAAEQAKSVASLTCFMGAGAYDHHIPAAVWDIASRGEFMTSYTPYQAEASQGTLQLLYEYQSMMAELTGMEVSNASLYDGASAVAEAALMAVRLQKHTQTPKILVAGSLHPHYQEVLDAIISNQSIRCVQIPFDANTGTIAPNVALSYIDEDCVALILPQPNFFGCLEQVDALTDLAHTHKLLVIGVVNPISLGLLKAPGDWGQQGADIVCGEGQPLGSPLGSGGPYFGFLTSKMTFVRQMPGRIVGRTVDSKGNAGYTLTLQAREQHIRRGKATSNICTNQGLLVTAATIHMALLGPEGIKNLALACHQNTEALRSALSSIPNITLRFNSAFFHELVIELPFCARTVADRMASRGILAGLALGDYFKELPNALLACVTEKRSSDDIANYAKTLQLILTELSELNQKERTLV